MRVRSGRAAAVILGVFFIGLAASASAQQCDDSNVCTTNDVCSEGLCMGTGQAGASCDFSSDCTVNGQCKADGSCGGDAAPNGTPCAGGCGTCQQLVPVPGVPPFCVPGPDVGGQACDVDIPCFVGTCNVVGGQVVFCQPAALQCPDTDGNLCNEGCNFETGQCERDAPKCFPPCETCNSGTGACQPANIGGACDDLNVCTAQSSCQQITVGQDVRGLCLGGDVTDPTPTSTPVDGGPTPTPTEQPTPGECVGDCGQDGEVTLGEVQVAFNVFLGTADPETCTDADADENNEVSLGEVQLAFNGFLGSCTG